VGDATSTSGIWIGPWTTNAIAIGVLAGPEAAATLRARFGPRADAIYYPYPLPYSTSRMSADDPQMMLMIFKVTMLPALDESPRPLN
jgi:hypothetical protein